MVFPEYSVIFLQKLIWHKKNEPIKSIRLSFYMDYREVSLQVRQFHFKGI